MKLAVASVGALAVGGIAMAWLGHKVVHTEVVIPASSEAIWAVLTDPTGYAAWNPILVRAEGEYREGTTLRYRMRDESGKESDITATVVGLEEHHSIQQHGGIRGVLTFDHTWRLESVEGGTRVVQHEEYRGIGVWFWDPSGVERLYQRANEALRTRVVERFPTGRHTSKEE
ncbi:MAG: SRPBCC domain-containing protein [Myxococcota bacterium]